MKRLSRITVARLSPRATVLTGAALGLCAGVTVYGAVSSAAESPTAFKPVAVATAPASAPVRYANCAAGAKLENGFCVTHVVRTVLATPSAASLAAAKAAQGANPAATVKPASTAGARTAPVATPTPATAAPVAPGAKATATPADDEAPAPKPTSTASPAPTPVPSAASGAGAGS